MGKISDYNKGSVFSADLSNHDWKKLEDIYCSPSFYEDQIFPLKGLYINEKSKYGRRPYAATDSFLVDLPMHLLETVEQIISNPEIVEQINTDHAGFKIRSYMSRTYNRECYTVVFVDR